MKKLIVLIMLVTLSACSAKQAETHTDLQPAPSDQAPVKMVYDRMWEYSDHGESEDSEYIQSVLGKIESFKKGEETDLVTEDYTDIVTFYYDDGSSVRYEFEEKNIVEDGKRYRVEGDLAGLRSLLEECLPSN